MSVFVYVEDWNGALKKASFEAVSYAKTWADMLGESVVALVSGAAGEVSSLATYGADEIRTFTPAVSGFGVAEQVKSLSEGAKGLVVAGTNFGKTVAPAVAALGEGALSTNTISAPLQTAPLQVKRGAFSSKGIETITLEGAFPIVCFTPNSIGIQERSGAGSISSASAEGADLLELVEKSVTTGKIALPEADVVVSAGRGLKGPENWGMVEELADVLGAATACSKPVSDIGWRPHSEHVGQTGIQVNPNLYIAIGISGAIQHLAGVSASKTIVVVNTDAEAPFFKAADYGFVGDAFEVVPRLVDALRAFKAAQ